MKGVMNGKEKKVFSKEALANITKKHGKWVKGPLAQWLVKVPERKKGFHTESGIPIKEIFTPKDIKEIDYIRDIGFPGEYPFTRGVNPSMYRSRPWSVRQITGLGGPAETNARMREQYAQGVTRMGGILDCNIYAAYVDPDDPEFDHLYGIESLGRTGYIATNLRDYEELYEGIPLDKVSVASMLGHFSQRETGMIFALAKRQGIPLEKLNGISQNDSMQLFNGNYYPAFPPEYELTLALDLVRFCSEHVPKWNCLSMAGYNRQEAGLNAYQEIGVTIADAATFIQEGIKFGIDAEKFVPMISFHWGFTMDFFEQIAKLRAARRMWAMLTRERFRIKNPAAWKMRFYLETSGSCLTAQQPYNNIIRVAIQAMGGVLAGANALHTASFDEALCAPTDFSAQLSLRTQQIIEHETGLADVVDPLAGSYYVEYLTNAIEKRAWEYVDKIVEMGGSIAAIRKGFFFRETQQACLDIQNQVENGDKVIVGVNRFQDEEKIKPSLYRGSKEAITQALARLQQVKKNRDHEKVSAALHRLQERVREGGRGSMEATIACCEAYCTFAEMNRAVKEICGVYSLAGDSILSR
ncbi:MAG: methylmalonyl-CoA mutase [Deltaproteobacteria bacterium]|nr:MAG: methylmalonyl-CoA mutase [Deltaproteobacteria bacterium]